MWERHLEDISREDGSVSAAITFASLIGLVQYIYSITLMLRERQGPFPVWMHAFYLAHDSSWSYRYYFAAADYDWHWFLLGSSLGLAMFSVLEIFCLYWIVEWERQETWGLYSRKPITRGYAISSILTQLAAFYALVNVLIQIMGEGSFIQWASFTNWIMAAGPGELWRRRTTRNGTSIGLAISIVVGTIFNFSPMNQTVLAFPEYYDNFWYYFAGVVFTYISVGNLMVLLELPPKKTLPGHSKPIW